MAGASRRLTAEDFPVSAEARRRIFADIVDELDAVVRPQKHPRLVFVVGQPASGKSRMLDRIESEAGHPVAQVDSDEMRLWHPDIDRIVAADPHRMDVLSNSPVGEWMSAAIAHCRTGRYDVVVENTLTAPEQVAATIGDFHDAGYRVEIVALATPGEVSRLGIATRYLDGVDNDRFARWTSRLSHDRAYAGMVTGLVALDGSVDRVRVYTRDVECVYDGTGCVSASEAVIAARGMPWSDETREAYRRDYVRMVSRLSDPGMLTATTAPLVADIISDGQRVLSAAELPDGHVQARGLVHAVIAGTAAGGAPRASDVIPRRRRTGVVRTDHDRVETSGPVSMEYRRSLGEPDTGL
ncbi:zeta toxin family protein [Corynebacterium bovis]|uniref:zeta toxin family protein n=1 Tax=Corynebacterium bovis TaxID=36808 RepID=UPI000F649B24|nr:zeta toxin family protein [Corynebacterium bovis]